MKMRIRKKRSANIARHGAIVREFDSAHSGLGGSIWGFFESPRQIAAADAIAEQFKRDLARSVLRGLHLAGMPTLDRLAEIDLGGTHGA